ncbi:MAG TPA: bifunctional 2-C-methyl-D-erythritol 4-phosphate cytidylyltransferase/2-C-methyl-D-erythritol 2,4-cyclodiphosphate synthase [Dongiaceae bacterium]|jgi:2-C-methyl-D-erythritol 4-phosphate cytidylyltransferase/2-C-methyl-D-erythritol 2,4-cyclodiphosphate synthase
MPGNAALIVAAGSGQRFGGELPKQYMTLAGRSILRRSIDAFQAHGAIEAIRVVISDDHRGLYDASTEGLAILPPVIGGVARQGSVRNGLESLRDLNPDKVLIHDAARPFVTAEVIDGVLAALDQHPGAIPAVAVTDTLKRGKEGAIGGTVDRAGLWRAQTPQGFRFAAILEAHRKMADRELTDDAALLEAQGMSVALVPGAEANFKITTKEDFERAARLLAPARDYLTGNGFDVHRFTAGDHVTICGIRVEHSHALEGHSDADVGLHAITDAVLGAIGAGDIGQHFPPTDPRWKGADSAAFLKHAVTLVGERGGSIVHVDVTIICERPKVGPHRNAMVQRVAEILGLNPQRVSVKATTTEGLGFTGRREGIAAQATATIALPAL